ncbi:hypothetical protein Q8A67_021909 [Cirrhinus molitorella]|uniref:Uncharacterized protein n=1 Tax=Cirrhinus molitorella TaxID=172907 RepID=A0AA88PII8_9TELE|nr:hypothetical protein Q8A67_021909 [Cirrhinus molitorella]
MSFSRYKVQKQWCFPVFSGRNIHRVTCRREFVGCYLMIVCEEIHTVKHEITASSADPAVCDSHQKSESGVQARLRFPREENGRASPGAYKAVCRSRGRREPQEI